MIAISVMSNPDSPNSRYIQLISEVDDLVAEEFDFRFWRDYMKITGIIGRVTCDLSRTLRIESRLRP